MNRSDTGTKDTSFQWKSKLATPNLKDWLYQSTPYRGALNSYNAQGVYTIAYTGGTSYAGGSIENFRYMRPALIQQFDAKRSLLVPYKDQWKG